ncbi:Transcription repressor OFP6 [Capsicum annuum]|uniref:Transcription repressor OFP6 n=1 Tax=Capsicum annuum TaxID=4072 RepID=A0A2G2ZS64_CAPAN|nr:Transcription repressor OFP6 [Capsicum annuum]
MLSRIAKILLVSSHPEVYEPCDDSFALVDALVADRINLLQHQPSICMEIDINPHALRVTSETVDAHGVYAELVNIDISSGLEKRLTGLVDVMVVNPPYVPTPEDEVGCEGITSAWAGGEDGRSICWRFSSILFRLNISASSLLLLKGIVFLDMTRRFKLKLSMPSFRFCRSNKASFLPKSPLPISLYKFSNGSILDNSPVPVPPSTPHHYSAYIFRKDHNLAHKTYNSPSSEYSDHDNNNMRRRRSRNSKLNMSFSSADSGWLNFTSECDDEKPNDETESFIFSPSFESSFDVDYPMDPLTGTMNRTKKNNNAKVRRLKRYLSNSFKDSVTKASVVERLMPSCMADGKVNESFAIVKKSADPYDDFKRSMMEMILEKEMFEAKDLEQLLLCFLSLNSRHYHAVIVEAFTEIWEELFDKSFEVSGSKDPKISMNNHT